MFLLFRHNWLVRPSLYRPRAQGPLPSLARLCPVWETGPSHSAVQRTRWVDASHTQARGATGSRAGIQARICQLPTSTFPTSTHHAARPGAGATAARSHGHPEPRPPGATAARDLCLGSPRPLCPDHSRGRQGWGDGPSREALSSVSQGP